MASNAGKVFEYMTLIGKLKRVHRTGWVLRGVSHPESVSDHMYRVAMTALLAPPPLNADKCVKMALVHDMAECIVGDLTPHDNVPKEEKHRREEEATQQLCSLVGEPVGSQLYTLWQEYENQETEEAKFVKDLDLLDMVVQAYEYEQQEQRPGFLQEFFDSTEGKFQTQTVQSWHQQLQSVRRPSLSQQAHPPPTSQASGHSSDTPGICQSVSSQDRPATGGVADGRGEDGGHDVATEKRRRVATTDSEKVSTGLAGSDTEGKGHATAGRAEKDLPSVNVGEHAKNRD